MSEQKPPYKIYEITRNSGEVFYTVERLEYFWRSGRDYYLEVAQYPTEKEARAFVTYYTKNTVKTKKEILL